MGEMKKVGNDFSKALDDISAKANLPRTKMSDIIGADMPEIINTKILCPGRGGKQIEITFKRRFKL